MGVCFKSALKSALLTEKGRRAAGGRRSAFFFAQRSKVGRVKYEGNNFWVPQAVCVTGSSPCSGEPRRSKVRFAPAYFFICDFKNKPSARSLAPPFRKKSRSAHLLGCKRPCNGSLSLPTFCEYESSVPTSEKQKNLFHVALTTKAQQGRVELSCCAFCLIMVL